MDGNRILKYAKKQVKGRVRYQVSVSDTARKRGAPQLGTLGSGNHFLEIQKVDKIFDEIGKENGDRRRRGANSHFNSLWFTGIGHQVCSDYCALPKEYCGKKIYSLLIENLRASPIIHQKEKVIEKRCTWL